MRTDDHGNPSTAKLDERVINAPIRSEVERILNQQLKDRDSVIASQHRQIIDLEQRLNGTDYVFREQEDNLRMQLSKAQMEITLQKESYEQRIRDIYDDLTNKSSSMQNNIKSELHNRLMNAEAKHADVVK